MHLYKMQMCMFVSACVWLKIPQRDSTWKHAQGWSPSLTWPVFRGLRLFAPWPLNLVAGLKPLLLVAPVPCGRLPPGPLPVLSGLKLCSESLSVSSVLLAQVRSGSANASDARGSQAPRYPREWCLSKDLLGPVLVNHSSCQWPTILAAKRVWRVTVAPEPLSSGLFLMAAAAAVRSLLCLSLLRTHDL